jgi:hypothetical protein
MRKGTAVVITLRDVSWPARFTCAKLWLMEKIRIVTNESVLVLINLLISVLKLII